MAWSWITSLVLTPIAVVVVFVALLFPAGSMTAAENDCDAGEVAGRDCSETAWRYTWTLSGEDMRRTDETNGTRDSRVEQRSWAEASADDVLGADSVRTARTLAFVALGLGLFGMALVIVGRFVHVSLGIAGGVLGIVMLLLAGFAILLAWQGLSDIGTGIKADLRANDLNWASKGPFMGLGLIILGVGGVLGAVGGIFGTLPGGYRRR